MFEIKICIAQSSSGRKAVREVLFRNRFQRIEETFNWRWYWGRCWIMLWMPYQMSRHSSSPLVRLFAFFTYLSTIRPTFRLLFIFNRFYFFLLPSNRLIKSVWKRWLSACPFQMVSKYAFISIEISTLFAFKFYLVCFRVFDSFMALKSRCIFSTQIAYETLVNLLL